MNRDRESVSTASGALFGSRFFIRGFARRFQGAVSARYCSKRAFPPLT